MNNEQELNEAYDKFAALQDASGEEYDMDAILRLQDDEDDDDEENEQDDEMLELVNVLHRGEFVSMKKLKDEQDMLLDQQTKYPEYLLQQGAHLLFIREVEQKILALLNDAKESSCTFRNLEPYHRKIIHTYAKKFGVTTMSENIHAKKFKGLKHLTILKNAKSRKPAMLLSEVLQKYDDTLVAPADPKLPTLPDGAVEELILSKLDEVHEMLRTIPPEEFVNVAFQPILGSMLRIKKKLKKMKHLVRSAKPYYQNKKRDNNRTKQGGVQFLHAGAMQQEVVSASVVVEQPLVPSTTTTTTITTTTIPSETANLLEEETVVVDFEDEEENSDEEEDQSEEEEEEDEEENQQGSSENEQDSADERPTGLGYKKDKQFAKFLDEDTSVGNTVKKMMQSMGFNFDKPTGLGKAGAGIVNPVKIEHKQGHIFNLVSDKSQQQQPSPTTKNKEPVPQRPVYEMKASIPIPAAKRGGKHSRGGSNHRGRGNSRGGGRGGNTSRGGFSKGGQNFWEEEAPVSNNSHESNRGGKKKKETKQKRKQKLHTKIANELSKYSASI